MRLLWLCLALISLSACATDRPIAFSCPSFKQYQIEVPVTPVSEVQRAETPLTTSLRGALVARGDRSEPTANILMLSGGGKWGAYGAGLYKAWGQHDRPQFDVVTGVSTGAMQATFAFLGEEDKLLQAYEIDKESDVVVNHGDLFFLTHGSTADLSPLESRIRTLIAPELDRVAEAGKGGRRLYVGTINALDGKMYAVDLTLMARSLTGAERLDCYTGALMSSAAIPAIFRQVTINDEPYYDGGVRNSVFMVGMASAAAGTLRADFEQRRSLAPEASRSAMSRPEAKLYILVNGDPNVSAISKEKGVKAALLPTLSRLKTIAFDQIEQSSIYTAHMSASQVWDVQTWVATAEGYDCKDPDETDQDIFDPQFMRCLSRFGLDSWNDGKTPWRPYPGP
jgi:predicted acylesterase/phospholipase RssA